MSSSRTALDLLALGFHVLPLHTAVDGRCSCGRPGCGSPAKHPRTQRGLNDASKDRVRIEEWAARWPDANWGIRTGGDLVVLDVDGEAGAASLREQEDRHGPLPATWSVRTARGRHFYFVTPATVRSSAGTLGVGLDVRGDGGHAVAAGSVHASGARYEWEQDPREVELALIPEWLFGLLVAEAECRTAAPAIEGEIPAGRRNETLTSFAGSMRRRAMSKPEITAALVVANAGRCRPPLADAEVAAIVRSVLRYAPAGDAEREPDQPLQLEVRTARAICTLPESPRSDELLGPLLVRGQRLVLGAGTGEGKTTMALSIVRAVARGERFLEWSAAESGRALVIDAEQGLRTVKRRLREAGLDDADNVDYLCVPDGLSLDSNPQHVAALEQVIATGRYSVVLLDPLYKLHAGDSNDERAAVDLMRLFDAWRADHGFALVLPAHRRKPLAKAKLSIHELHGSGAWVRGAEVVLGLERVRDGYSRLHFLKDRDGDLPASTAWGLLFNRDHGYRRDPDDDKPRKTAAQAVAELLEAQPGMTKAQLAVATAYAERTVAKALTEVRAVSDRPGQRGEKRWRLPDEETDG